MPLRKIIKSGKKRTNKKMSSSSAIGTEAILPKEVKEGLRMAQEQRKREKARKVQRVGKAVAKGGIVFIFSMFWNFIKGLFSASVSAIRAGKKAYKKR